VALSGYSSPERYETICTRSSVSIPFADHLVEDRHDAVDLLGCIDDLDHDRQILGQPQDPGRVEAGAASSIAWAPRAPVEI
jgi:hypothetical protein